MLEVSAKYDSRKPGFALVVALALMGLVLALIISMTLMIQVETQATSSAMEHLRAKESAQLALMVAIGELQKHAGPDQRVTARAEILGSTVQNGERYWTGSWNTNDPSAPPIWLVSGQTPDPTSPSATKRPRQIPKTNSYNKTSKITHPLSESELRFRVGCYNYH